MKHLNNLVVVVGDNRENSGKYSTQLNPVKLEENVGIAIISIFHSTICNIKVFILRKNAIHSKHFPCNIS